MYRIHYKIQITENKTTVITVDSINLRSAVVMNNKKREIQINVAS